MDRAAWLASEDAAQMLGWRLSTSRHGGVETAGPVSDRKLRLFACACCRRAMKDYPSGDEIILRSFEDGSGISSPHARSRGVAAVQGLPAGEAAMWWASSRGVGRPGYPDAFAAPKGEMAALLREVVDDPFALLALPGWRTRETDGSVTRHDCPWLTPTGLALARHAYDARDFAGLPALADALEEAGCDAEALLRHLRGEELVPSPHMANLGLWRPRRGPHVRGCWAVDLLLGKE